MLWFSSWWRRDSAWFSVRGKPSSKKPPPQRRQPLRSRIISQTMESGTRSPRRMYSSAAFIAGLRSHSRRPLAARNTSPVERWQAFSRWWSRSAWVPLPTPGGPRRISRQGSCALVGWGLQRAEGPWSQAERSGWSGEAMPEKLRAGGEQCGDARHAPSCRLAGLQLFEMNQDDFGGGADAQGRAPGAGAARGVDKQVTEALEAVGVGAKDARGEPGERKDLA